MEKIKTIIVDDESLARKKIRTLLKGEEDFEIISECAGGAQAAGAIEQLRPDLVFLDIQMPVMDGFDVLAAIEGKHLPFVVFVTAFNRYAVRAFDVEALDYLLKPVKRKRFQETLFRIRKHLSRSGEREEDAYRGRINRLLERVDGDHPSTHRLLVRSEGKILFLLIREIDWVEAARNYMRLHGGKKTVLLRETMGSLEKRLPRDRFVRINRSTIVNLESIREMQPAFNGEYTITIKNGKELRLSRNYKADFEIKLGSRLR